MELKKVSLERFKKIIYPEYKKIFPLGERKSYRRFKKSYTKGITDIIEITIENEFIGFFIMNYIKENPYIVLDYFAILPKYRCKGYGTEAIKLLKEMYKNYNGIFIEIEQVGGGDTKEENNERQRRARFYEKLGFYKLDFDLKLFAVTYSAYILNCSSDENLPNDKIIEYIFNIYFAVIGEKRVKKNCKVIK